MTAGTILVATWSDGLFVVNGDRLTQELINQPVRGLTGDGDDGALAIVGRHSLCRRSPDGTWTTLANSDLELSCCLVVRDTVYVGTDDARLLRLAPASDVLCPIDGFDRVAGRESWFAGSAMIDGKRMGPPLGIRSLAANADGAVLFANVHVGGIPRSMDQGATWEPTIDIHSDVHEVRAHPRHPGIVAAASAVGLCLSRDYGATWIIEREGLHATHCLAVALSGDDILFSASTSPFATEGRIYRRPLNPDGPLSVVASGPERIEGVADTGCIAATGPAIAIVDKAGRLYRSGDFGRTWSYGRVDLPGASGVLVY